MHIPGIGNWTNLFTMLIRLLIFNSLLNTKVYNLSLFRQESFDILMGRLDNAYLGWTGSCLILDPINIYWCKTRCKWSLANQDWWLLSVSSKYKMCNIFRKKLQIVDYAGNMTLRITLGWLRCLPKQLLHV